MRSPSSMNIKKFKEKSLFLIFNISISNKINNKMKKQKQTNSPN
jgi:hypothetical protein